MELHNAGRDAPHYNEQRICFVHEFLVQFPNVDDNRYLNLRRAEGEALWNLDRQAEAEVVYRALIEKLPDEGWAYIGWSDQYYLWQQSTKDYKSAEPILRQALARPTLKDRADVLDRLVDLYEEWGQPEKQAPFLAELEEIRGSKVIPRILKPPPAMGKLAQLFGPSAPKPPKSDQAKKLKRNDPCWCGSGKKYKNCHLKSDKK
jgi:tetratricopeptide (TPR) repeat protein